MAEYLVDILPRKTPPATRTAATGAYVSVTSLEPLGLAARASKTLNTAGAWKYYRNKLYNTPAETIHDMAQKNLSGKSAEKQVVGYEVIVHFKDNNEENEKAQWKQALDHLENYVINNIAIFETAHQQKLWAGKNIWKRRKPSEQYGYSDVIGVIIQNTDDDQKCPKFYDAAATPEQLIIYKKMREVLYRAAQYHDIWVNYSTKDPPTWLRTKNVDYTEWYYNYVKNIFQVYNSFYKDIVDTVNTELSKFGMDRTQRKQLRDNLFKLSGFKNKQEAEANWKKMNPKEQFQDSMKPWPAPPQTSTHITETETPAARNADAGRATSPETVDNAERSESADEATNYDTILPAESPRNDEDGGDGTGNGGDGDNSEERREQRDEESTAHQEPEVVDVSGPTEANDIPQHQGGNDFLVDNRSHSRAEEAHTAPTPAVSNSLHVPRTPQKLLNMNISRLKCESVFNLGDLNVTRMTIQGIVFTNGGFSGDADVSEQTKMEWYDHWYYQRTKRLQNYQRKIDTLLAERTHERHLDEVVRMSPQDLKDMVERQLNDVQTQLQRRLSEEHLSSSRAAIEAAISALHQAIDDHAIDDAATGDV